jgi:hypothetical protein
LIGGICELENQILEGPWGWHLRLDLKDCDRYKITTMTHFQNFVDILLATIDMVAHGPLRIERFGKGALNGISFFQFIETSCIMGHCNESGGHSDIYIDIFSCCRFDDMLATELCIKYFECKEFKSDFVGR